MKQQLPAAALLLAASVAAACLARQSSTDAPMAVLISSARLAPAASNDAYTNRSGTDRESARPVLAEVAAAVEVGQTQAEAAFASLGLEAAAAVPAAPQSPEGSVTAADVAGVVAADVSRMSIPFHTQKDGDRFQGSNCGPAALGMVLEAFGMVRGNADLRFLTHTYQGTVGARTGTALQHMAHVAADFGLEPIGLYQRPDGLYQKDGFARWTVEDVRAEVLAGRPVIPLVKFRLLPGHEDSPFRADHYVVIYGVEGDSFLYHDPLYESPWEGAGRWMSADQLAAAMKPTLVPQQAVSFAPGKRDALQTS